MKQLLLRYQLLLSIIFLLPGVFAFSQNTQLMVKAGTNFITSAGNLVLQNTDVTNNGTLNVSGGSTVFLGANTSLVNGTSPFAVKVFAINKPGATVKLNTGVTVNNMVDFQGGLIDLNNQTIALGSGAFLNNETATSRITGTSGGKITASAPFVVNPSALNIGNLGAAITSSQNLGNITIARTHKPAQDATATHFGIQRTYLIQPINNASLNATLRFYYFDTELNGKSEATLSLWRSNDGLAWTEAGVTSRDAVNNYIEKTGLVSLSYFTLTDLNNALPVTLSYFRASCHDKYALLEWQTAIEINTSRFEIERSTDAISWKTLQSVTATNNATGSSYTFKDNDPQPTAYYRLKIIDISGVYTYSNVFSGGCADIAMPFTIYPNPVVDQAVARISVRQATDAVLSVYNSTGQELLTSQWHLQTGSNQLVLPLTNYAAGIYFVKVLVNGTYLKTQLIKQ